jgi:hypothetical protein
MNTESLNMIAKTLGLQTTAALIEANNGGLEFYHAKETLLVVTSDSFVLFGLEGDETSEEIKQQIQMSTLSLLATEGAQELDSELREMASSIKKVSHDDEAFSMCLMKLQMEESPLVQVAGVEAENIEVMQQHILKEAAGRLANTPKH